MKASHGRWRKVVALSRERNSDEFFRVPFSVVPRLVARRMVALQHGLAVVPFYNLHDVLEHCFELSLQHGLWKCKSDQESLDTRCRILRRRLQVKFKWSQFYLFFVSYFRGKRLLGNLKKQTCKFCKNIFILYKYIFTCLLMYNFEEYS
jgi:hypothetical protein